MKRLALIAGAVVALLLVTALAVPFFIDPNRFRPMLEEKLSQALGREGKLGDLKLSILSGAVKASDLSISDNPAYSRQPFVQAKSLAVSVEVWPLITSRQLHVTGLTIEQPSITLIQSPNGDWNFSTLGGQSAAAPSKPAAAPASHSDMDLSVKLVKITGGQFTLSHSGTHNKALVLQDVNLEVKDFSAASTFPFTFSTTLAGGGTLKLDGKAGPMDPSDSAATPIDANLVLDHLDLVGTGVTQTAPAVAGLISLTGACRSDGKVAHITGKLKGEKLKLAKGGTPAKRVVEFDFAADHDLRKRSGRLSQGDIHIGAAPAHLTGTYAPEKETTALHMRLDGPKMSIPELAEMLPAMGIVLPNGSSLQGGTATVKLDMEGVLDSLVTSGSVSVDNTKLAGFDMGRNMSVSKPWSGSRTAPIPRFKPSPPSCEWRRKA
jgi:AsmA protein